MHTNYSQHSAEHQSSTTHLAPPPTPHAFATASNKHTNPVLPLTLPTGNFWPLAHAHTALRARAAHDPHTHHNPTQHTWPSHHLLTVPEPPPTHTIHLRTRTGLTLPVYHSWPTAHAHTALRARAAHDIHTHHNPTQHTWPSHHLLAAPEPPPTHTNHLRT